MKGSAMQAAMVSPIAVQFASAAVLPFSSSTAAEVPGAPLAYARDDVTATATIPAAILKVVAGLLGCTFWRRAGL